MKILLFLAVLFSPIATFAINQMVHHAEMWWCKGCGLAYPASQKFCLNKDCPLFRKPKSSK